MSYTERTVRVMGEESQIIKSAEEMMELGAALLRYIHHLHSTDDYSNRDMLLKNITEEMADVNVMMAQLYQIFCNEFDVGMVMERKIKRLVARLDVMEGV